MPHEMLFRTQPPPESEPEPDDDSGTSMDVLERLAGFVNLGFDELTALALSWKGCSPSDVRERFLKRGATHEQAARALL